jgi:WXG100 family type VII secretion target
VGAQPQTQVSKRDLEDAIRFINAAAVELSGIQRRLDAAGVALATGWKGESAHAFNAVHKKWHDRMDVILRSLQRLAENIGASNKNYAEFNAERTQAANRIHSLINNYDYKV